jgi:hypothetical protein
MSNLPTVSEWTGDFSMLSLAHSIRCAAFGFIVAIAMSASAARAEVLFTFDVPVELNNLHPDFRQGRVTCYAQIYLPGSFAGATAVTNGANSEFAITSGRYSGTVTVTLDDTFLAAGRRAGEANGYWCRIRLNNGRDWLEPDAILRWGPAAAGTTPQLSINGLFPR